MSALSLLLLVLFACSTCCASSSTTPSPPPSQQSKSTSTGVVSSTFSLCDHEDFFGVKSVTLSTYSLKMNGTLMTVNKAIIVGQPVVTIQNGSISLDVKRKGFFFDTNVFTGTQELCMVTQCPLWAGLPATLKEVSFSHTSDVPGKYQARFVISDHSLMPITCLLVDFSL